MMRGMNKKQIAELGQEWADLETKRRAKEAAKSQELKPLTDRYDRACAPVNEKFNTELSPIITRQKELLDTIQKNLLAGVSPDGSIKIPLVEGDHFTAKVLESPTRSVAPFDFIEATPKAKRTSAFWDCLNVLVTKADKFMGKDEVAKIAKTDTSHRVELKFK